MPNDPHVYILLAQSSKIFPQLVEHKQKSLENRVYHEA